MDPLASVLGQLGIPTQLLDGLHTPAGELHIKMHAPLRIHGGFTELSDLRISERVAPASLCGRSEGKQNEQRDAKRSLHFLSFLRNMRSSRARSRSCTLSAAAFSAGRSSMETERSISSSRRASL